MDDQPRIVYRTEVKPAGAVRATRKGETVIVIDPDLTWLEQQALIKELMEDECEPSPTSESARSATKE